jgi:tRNA/tmRNA/rRNA uracil-C5-methylase (TrmA/RlmC/RlmD family)
VNIYEGYMDSIDKNYFLIKIDDVAFGGAGVGRADDGIVHFIPGVITGERVLAKCVRRKKSFAESEAIEIVEGCFSEDR